MRPVRMAREPFQPEVAAKSLALFIGVCAEYTGSPYSRDTTARRPPSNAVTWAVSGATLDVRVHTGSVSALF